MLAPLYKMILFIEESWLWLDSNGCRRVIRSALKPLS